MEFKEMKFYGERLFFRRGLKGIKIEDLAKKIGKSKGYISNLENGIKNNPSLNVINSLARELDIDALYFFEDNIPTNMLPACPDEVLNFLIDGSNLDYILAVVAIKNWGIGPKELLQAIGLIRAAR